MRSCLQGPYLDKYWLIPSHQQSHLGTEHNHKVQSLLSRVGSGHFWPHAAEAITEFCTPALCCAVTRWQQVKNMCAGGGELCLAEAACPQKQTSWAPWRGWTLGAIGVVSILLPPLRCCHFLPCCLCSIIFPPCLSVLVFNSFLLLERPSQEAESKIWVLFCFLLDVHLDWPASQMLSISSSQSSFLQQCLMFSGQGAGKRRKWAFAGTLNCLLNKWKKTKGSPDSRDYWFYSYFNSFISGGV